MSYTFNNIAGYKTEKEELERICEVLKNREKYLKKGAKLPKGIIFYGEAGTGKTLFTKVLADECGLYTYKIDIANLNSSTQICKQIKKTFEKASKQKEPSMIFFDELDKLLPNAKEEYYTDQSKMVLAQLLTLIDGMSSANNFIFVATCNDYGCLPETLVRPGRIDKKIYVGQPTYESRVEILNLYASKSDCKFEITMEEIAKLCAGYSCSALETLVNECIILSDKNNFVSKELITKKVYEIKKEDIPRETSKTSDVIEACRNIGCFVVAKTFNNGKYFLNLDSNNLGNAFFNKILSEFDDDYDEYDDDYDEDNDTDECLIMKDDEIKYFSKEDLLNAISVILGGYVAQQTIFNKIYDSMYGVLTNIDSILMNMSRQGMFGIENIYTSWRNEKLPYTVEFTNRLNNIFANTIFDCYQVAIKIINKNIHLIERLIPILVEKRYMDYSICESILKEIGGIIR